MAEVKPFDSVLKACSWVLSTEELVESQPDLVADWPRMESIQVGDDRFHGIPIVFSEDLEGPLCSFLVAAFDAALERSGSIGEAPERLKATLVALLVACPVQDSTSTQSLLLELARQSSAMFSGALRRERLGTPLKRLSGMPPAEQGLVRRRVVRRLIACLNSAVTEAREVRPRLRPPALFHQLVSCPLIFSHSSAQGEELKDLRLLGAELGIEVDGDLLHDLNCALEEAIRHQTERGSMAHRVQARVAKTEIHPAVLRPEDLNLLFGSFQSELRVKDLLRRGLSKERAKSLLRMNSSGVLFEVYRQLHRQLRRFDVLAALASRILPIRLSSGGGFTAFGAVKSDVRWHFLRPRLQIDSIDFSVVSLSLGALIGAAVKREQRDEQPKAVPAFWGLWGGLVQEAEAEGGVATLRGDTGVAVFLSADQAQTFIRSAKEQLSLPMSLHYGSEEKAIVLPGVTVDFQCERGPVFGAWVGEHIVLWGPLFGRHVSVPNELDHGGFSILTEIGDAETELHTSDTEFEAIYQGVDGSMDYADEALDTLDSFFLPARGSHQKQGEQFDIGLSLEDVLVVLQGYGHYASADGQRVFGKPGDQVVNDCHAYPSGSTLLDATCAFLLDKYKEGFAPRADSIGELPSEMLLEALPADLLEEALEVLANGKQ